MPSRRKKTSRSRSTIAVKSNPKLWNQIKNKWIRSSKAGAPGKISARKMQLAVQEYKRRGGKYKGSKKKNSLKKWTREKWGYINKGSSKGRYLPEKVRRSLTPSERRLENRIKGSRRGKWIKYSHLSGLKCLGI